MDPSFLSQMAQSLSKPDDSLQESILPQFPLSKPLKPKIPSWSKFHLKNSTKIVQYSGGVIMGHYLVVLASFDNEHSEDNNSDYDQESDQSEDEPPCLLAFSLIDYCVQKAEINQYPFRDQDGLRLLKYGDNQIIVCGNWGNMMWITVESFERILLILLRLIAFKVHCEVISNKMPSAFPSQYTAQIYLDYLIVYGSVRTLYDRRSPILIIIEFWWFDLKKHFWELRRTTGEAPILDNDPKSFISQHILYVYGVIQDKQDLPDLFMLNLITMKWTRIPQENEFLQAKDGNQYNRSGGAVYKGHLITLQRPPSSHKNALCFLDLETKDTWSTFHIEGINKYKRMSRVQTGGLMMYKNWVVTVTTAGYDQNLVVAMMNIENFEIPAGTAHKSNYEAEIHSAFMSQKGSDVAFSVGNQYIPAHKRILAQKSRYFEKVFNSGMAESKQYIIEVKDCEYEIFKEYLRWIYQDTVKFSHEDQAIKIHTLADKYRQKDLCQKCQDFLTSIIDMDNVFTILEFADREDLVEMKNWCFKCLMDKLDVANIIRLIRFLNDHQEFKESNLDFRNQAFHFILDEFLMIVDHEKGNIQIYEDFIVENIKLDDIPALALFLTRDIRKIRSIFIEIYEHGFEDKEGSQESEGEDSEDEIPPRTMPPITQDFFERCTAYLKAVVFCFMQENMKLIMTNGMAEDLPFSFLKEFMLEMNEGYNNLKKEVETLKKTNKKRMEPGSSDGEGEEGPELKKTKKHDPGYGN